MKRITLLTILVVFTFTGIAFAQGPVITTGEKGKSYIRSGSKLRGMIGGKVIPSRGSGQNIKRVVGKDDVKADVGFTQMDSYALAATKDHSIEERAEIMGPLFEECVFIAANKNGRVTDEDDLQKEGVNIAIGKKGSGSIDTWDYMRQLEPGYKKAGVKFTGGMRALGKLASQPEGTIDAVMWTEKPVIKQGGMIASVIKNKNLVFIDVDDKDLNDVYKPTGKPIYRFKKIDTKKGFGGGVSTICFDSVVIADAEGDEEMLDEISNIMLNYRNSIMP